MTLLDDIKRRIKRVRTKERTVLFTAGVSRVVGFGVSGLLVYFLVDWLSEPPYWARLLGFCCLVAAVCWNVVRHVVAPLRREMDDDEVALRVESRHPELQGRLISTIQLMRSRTQGAFVGSEELLKALEAETLRMASPLDFLRVIDKEKMVKFLVAAMVVVLIQTVCVVRFPEYFAALALRLVKPQQQYPTDTRIMEISAPDFVARGDSIPVKVLLNTKYVVPSEPGSLVFTSVKDGAEIPVALVQVDGGVFKGRLAKALDDVTVEAFLGDARFRLERVVQVLPRPEIAGGEVRYRYPKYTGKPPSGPQEFGGLSALRGTRAQIHLSATKALVSAEIQRADGTALKMVQTDGNGREWKLAEPFLIDRNTNFMVNLKDRRGLANSTPRIVYPVEAIPDRPPSIKLREPLRDATVTPEAEREIVFDAKDDYGVRMVWLVYRVKKAGLPESSAKEKRVGTKVVAKDRRHLAGGTVRFPLAKLGLKPGDEVVFWLEADDDCAFNDVPPERKGTDKPGGGEGVEYPRTVDIKFTVVSAEEKRLEAMSKLMHIVEEVEAHKKRQTDLKNKLREQLEKVTPESDR